MNEPTVADLLATPDLNQEDDHRLAALYAPILMFDSLEPFFPLAAGYTVYRASAPSASFPRQIKLSSESLFDAQIAIEYAIWWDWDISHLYELEHVWVYLDESSKVIFAEASWHGEYHCIEIDGTLPLAEGRLLVFSEPGKHAMAPIPSWFERRASKTRKECQNPGRGGVWVTAIFEGIIHAKSPKADRLVRDYLERYAFEPSLKFTEKVVISSEHLVPWHRLFEWIPRRVDWWVAELERRSSSL